MSDSAASMYADKVKLGGPIVTGSPLLAQPSNSPSLENADWLPAGMAKNSWTFKAAGQSQAELINFPGLSGPDEAAP